LHHEQNISQAHSDVCSWSARAYGFSRAGLDAPLLDCFDGQRFGLCIHLFGFSIVGWDSHSGWERAGDFLGADLSFALYPGRGIDGLFCCFSHFAKAGAFELDAEHI